jgi:hypothetical protein
MLSPELRRIKLEVEQNKTAADISRDREIARKRRYYDKHKEEICKTKRERYAACKRNADI